MSLAMLACSEQGVAAADPQPSFKLQGNMGTWDLLFTVLAFTAPLGVVFGFLSYNIRFGIGVPVAFIGVTVLILLFAIGFTRMTREVPRAGAFYTYIVEGLGRPVGLGGSLLALVTYGFNILAALVFAGIAVNNLARSFGLAGDVHWWIWSFAMLAAVWSLSYFNVEFSAKVLTAVLIVEVTAILIFDSVVIWNGGPEGRSLAPWDPGTLLTPSIGLLMLFSVGVFNGFEATAIYRDEVREPETMIPRATYLAVLFLGVFYAISSYALVISAGVSRAVSAAVADPAAMMPHALLVNFGPVANQIIAVLLVSSIFASSLSLQNILARYTHSLSVDGVFHPYLNKVHARHGSPHRSAVAVGCILFGLLSGLAMTQWNAVDLYGAAAGIAFYGMLLLLFLTSLAIIIYFRRNPTNQNLWATLVAPVVAGLGLGIELIVATRNIGMLITGSPAVICSLVATTYLAIGAGIAIALRLRRSGSEIYERIGRKAA